MSFQEILYYAEILGRDEPRVKRMVQKALLFPETAHIIRRHMLHTLRNLGYDLTELPAFGRLAEEDKHEGGILIGYVIEGK